MCRVPRIVRAKSSRSRATSTATRVSTARCWTETTPASASPSSRPQPAGRTAASGTSARWGDLYLADQTCNNTDRERTNSQRWPRLLPFPCRKLLLWLSHLSCTQLMTDVFIKQVVSTVKYNSTSEATHQRGGGGAEEQTGAGGLEGPVQEGLCGQQQVRY